MVDNDAIKTMRDAFVMPTFSLEDCLDLWQDWRPNDEPSLSSVVMITCRHAQLQWSPVVRASNYDM